MWYVNYTSTKLRFPTKEKKKRKEKEKERQAWEQDLKQHSRTINPGLQTVVFRLWKAVRTSRAQGPELKQIAQFPINCTPGPGLRVQSCPDSSSASVKCMLSWVTFKRNNTCVVLAHTTLGCGGPGRDPESLYFISLNTHGHAFAAVTIIIFPFYLSSRNEMAT